MANYAEYFSKVTYKPTYHLGDRVRGKWNNIPFSGTVSIDNMLDPDVGPFVIVTLDLPIKKDGLLLNLLKVQHSDILQPTESFYESGNKKKSRPSKRVR